MAFDSILFADDTTITEPLCTSDLLTVNNKYDKKKLSDNLNAWIYVKYMNGNVSIKYRCMYTCMYLKKNHYQ